MIEELTRLPNGLILVTGPTGVGKTTTLNFMIDLINHNRRAKIVTIEDPVEFVHDNLRSIIVQQEVGTDVRSFPRSIGPRLAQDPDVIVIGEMRDLETIETALIAAETGHLVLATLHTPDTVQTIQRISSVFPADQQNAIIVQLAATLQAAFAQKLLPRADGKGRVLACEVLISTPRDTQPHSRTERVQSVQRDADGPQAPDADHGLRPAGTLPEGRNHLRSGPVARPRTRVPPPSHRGRGQAATDRPSFRSEYKVGQADHDHDYMVPDMVPEPDLPVLSGWKA